MEEQSLTWKEKWIRLLYPPRCICCDALVAFHAPLQLCRDCGEHLPILARREHTNPVGSSNGKVYSAFEYEGGIRKAIHHLKFHDNPGNASVLIHLCFLYMHELLHEEKPGFIPKPKYDIIIPVPLHTRRKRQRGYNQSELLANCLAKHLRLPVCVKVLFKQVNTPAQSTLDRGERFRNLTGAFHIKNAERICNQRILLVDDIMTTGTTLEQCAKVLMASGAQKVDAFAVAIRRKQQMR